MRVRRSARLERLALALPVSADPSPMSVDNRPTEQIDIGADRIGPCDHTIARAGAKVEKTAFRKGKLHAAAYADRARLASNEGFESMSGA